ncbi:MAG TPA: hypothetical protein VLI06_12980 [Solimonas sp.]|nr:hypothetical protein [Solimonas sp.]
MNPAGWRALLRLAWPLPWTLAGLLLALPALAGGKLQWRRIGDTHALCACGGLTGAALALSWISAITFGHLVLARDDDALERTLAHELAHVRQYERWGLLFPFLYLWASWQAWHAGGRAYYDNRYEVEARRAESA